jgi:diacylglycerol kinase (ATP)
MQAELIYNAYAGRCVVRRELDSVVEYLEDNGWAVSVRETRAPREGTDLARRAAAQGVEVVIAAGGDGTVNEVASGLVNTETALGVLPVGTTNVWALQMRIPVLSPLGLGAGLAKLVVDLEERVDYPLPVNYYRSVLLAAARVLVEGQTHTVDVGQANDRYFLMWAGVGLDAAVTVSVSPEDKKALGPWAFVGTALDVVRDYKSAAVRLDMDGEVKQADASLIVASNIQLYGGLVRLGARACIDDGKLDVCVFKGEGLLNYAQHIFKVASLQHLQDLQIEYHLDDEPFAETPVSIRVIPGALKVILPQNVPRDLFAGG